MATERLGWMGGGESGGRPGRGLAASYPKVVTGDGGALPTADAYWLPPVPHVKGGFVAVPLVAVHASIDLVLPAAPERAGKRAERGPQARIASSMVPECRRRANGDRAQSGREGLAGAYRPVGSSGCAQPPAPSFLSSSLLTPSPHESTHALPI